MNEDDCIVDFSAEFEVALACVVMRRDALGI